MVLILAKECLLQFRVTTGLSLTFGLVSAIQRFALASTKYEKFIFSKKIQTPRVLEFCPTKFQIPACRFISTSIHPTNLSWEGSSSAVLLRKLEAALEDHQIDEAWECFNDFKRLYGFPNDSVMLMLVSQLAYTLDCNWLQKACNLILQISKEKRAMLQLDVLTKLSLALARSQMPIPTSTIVRLMLETKRLPPMKVLQLIMLHMVKTEIGSYLASNILVQACDCFSELAAKRNDQAKPMKPDTMIFNLVLNACVRFKLSFKGQQLIELMARIGVVADAHTIVLIARIHDMSDQRDGLMKFKVYIDPVSSSFICHYRQFYDSLLSLHFKFGDFESATNLVLEMCSFGKSGCTEKHGKDLQKFGFVPIGSHNLKAGLKIQIMPGLMQKDSVLNVEEAKPEFINYKNGKLVICNKALAKLIIEFKEPGRTSELSKLLVHVQNEMASMEGSNLSSVVAKACICLGWLETAHDILDDMDAAGYAMEHAVYFSLLKAYDEQNMPREADLLRKQMKEAGVLINIVENKVVSKCSSEFVDGCSVHETEPSTHHTGLVESLVQELQENNAISARICKFNSSIYFFCKAGMIDDAMKAYKRMQQMGIPPTLLTYTNLACGYYSLQLYRDITILWGDIKRNMQQQQQSGDLVLSRDFYEFLLLCFMHGGYFERVMEIASHMEERSMYTDKLMYKAEFLKLHKNLYRSLTPFETKTEAQKKRLEYVRAFKKWVGFVSSSRRSSKPIGSASSFNPL